MNIRKIEGIERCTLHYAIEDWLAGSRFKAKIAPTGQAGLRITMVRLKTAKEWCGSHAKACEASHEGKHGNPKRTFLEGADWVEFNDSINDILDEHDVSAEVKTTTCELRDGRYRRIYYDSNESRGEPGDPNFEHLWDYDGPAHHYKDCCGEKAPRSDFPEGTPGIYEALDYHEIG